MRDSSFTLNEQFCLARIYAISNSENLASQVQGFTTAQLLEQCERLAPAMKGEIAALSIGSRLEVIENTEAFILSTGMSPAQLTHTARICLGIGYRTDNADVALASNLILVSLGEPAYGEMLGHHLFNGFGTSGRNDLALQWFDSAILALQSGAPAVFAPGQADRPLLLEAAVAELRPSGVSVPTTTAGFAVPSFSAASGN